jgi:hypothetical protein
VRRPVGGPAQPPLLRALALRRLAALLVQLVGASSTPADSRFGSSCTTEETVVRTSTAPLRSTMSPRGASIDTLRTRFSRAWDT